MERSLCCLIAHRNNLGNNEGEPRKLLIDISGLVSSLEYRDKSIFNNHNHHGLYYGDNLNTRQLAFLKNNHISHATLMKRKQDLGFIKLYPFTSLKSFLIR